MNGIPFRHALVVFGVLLLSSLWPTGATRAADDSNIPGVPLPGSTVTGTLGGPVYDRVFSIDVPTDRIVLIALSGDPGTDFDLYLFDAGATTVYSTAGQVAASTSNTSTESITYATRGGGRFYIDLNGATNVLGAFRLTVKIAADVTVPTAILRLNDGAPATPDSTIRVSLVATDDLSGVTDMQFSLDGRRWDEWRAYQPFALWSFPQVDGPRQLWARVRDGSGNVSSTTAATILIDTVSPTIISRSPGPDSETTSLRPVFQVRFSESIAPASWTVLGILLQDPSGATIPGAYSYDDATQTGSFTPGVDLIAGDAYLATLGAVTDLAGNPVAQIGTWVVRPVHQNDPTLTVDHAAASFGSLVNLHGHVTLPLDGAVILQRSVAGGAWSDFGSVRPDGVGDFSVPTTATSNSRFRLHITASLTQSEAFSAVVSVTVRRAVALRSIDATVTRRVARGTSVSLRAVVAPAQPDVVVTFTVYRYDSVRRAYVAIGAVPRRTVASLAAWTWKPTASGSYYLRLSTGATPEFAAGASTTYRWTVTS